MSSESLNQEQSSKKSKKDEKNTSKRTSSDLSATQSQAGTSKSFQSSTERKKSKKKEDDDSWGFFPKSLWFWKQEEAQPEVQAENWSLTSEKSILDEEEIQLNTQQPVRKTESQYIWPNTINIQEPQRLVNQPTLDQIIEQKKLRENQLKFSQDFDKHVDYLGDRMSKTKLNILIAQLNNILPSTSEEKVDSTKKLTRAKPLQATSSSSQQLRRKASKVSEHLSPEEVAERDQLRQNQLQEYENIRDQVDLFEDRSMPVQFNKSNISSKENTEHVMDETISKHDLDKLIDLLNQMPNAPKDDLETYSSLKELIQSKPRIVEFLKHVFKSVAERLVPEENAEQEQLRENQLQEFEDLRDQITVYEDRSAAALDTSKHKMTRSVIEETLSKTTLNNLITQLNEPVPLQMQEQQPESSGTGLFGFKKYFKIAKRLKPEEIALQEQLRQNQIQEYENLREQIGLFGEKRSTSDVTVQERKEISLEGTMSKRELNLFIDQLNEVPHSKEQTTFTSSENS